MNTLETADGEIASGSLRIAKLEREAGGQSGEAVQGLQAHLDRYQSLLLAIAQVIWTSDSRGRMLDEQPSWAAYTGQTREQYQGGGWLDAVHPDDRARTLELWAPALTAHTPYEVEHRLRHRDGEYRYFSVRAVPMFAADDSIREWVGIHTDISQRKLTEKSLRDGAQRFRELADAMPQIVWGAGPDGEFDYFNRRWYEFTGRAEAAGGDASWADIVHPDDHQESVQRWQSALAAGSAYEIEYRLKRKDGAYRWYLTRALPVRDSGQRIKRWFGTCTDIDERKRTEDELRAATVSLLQSNRELEDFAAIASHDLQEPLRKIRAFVGCLRDEPCAIVGTEAVGYLDRIENAAERMTTLISDLLEFSLISSKGRPLVPVDLNRVAAEVVSDLEARLEETSGRVEVRTLPTISSDPLQMRQLLQNLIGNALKFHRKEEPPRVVVNAEIIENVDAAGGAMRGAHCRLTVADNGIGFDETYRDRVFSIFQRLHGRGEYPGTGIGLAVCRKIVELHGGVITAHSAPGRGSTFVVSMPVLEGSGDSHVR